MNTPNDTQKPTDNPEVTQPVDGFGSGELLGIPTQMPYGFLSDYFLKCDENGVISVKDGRSLEEYINDPRLVSRRKGSKVANSELVLCHHLIFEMGLMTYA